jgi:hypothetical protein
MKLTLTDLIFYIFTALIILVAIPLDYINNNTLWLAFWAELFALEGIVYFTICNKLIENLY